MKGDHTNFEIEPSFGVEASQLYPDVKYTSVEEYLDQFVWEIKPQLLLLLRYIIIVVGDFKQRVYVLKYPVLCNHIVKNHNLFWVMHFLFTIYTCNWMARGGAKANSGGPNEPPDFRIKSYIYKIFLYKE